jgi:hypothetical protein
MPLYCDKTISALSGADSTDSRIGLSMLINEYVTGMLIFEIVSISY